MFLIQQQVSSKSVLKYFLSFCCFWAKKTKQKNQKEKKHAIKRICQKKEVESIRVEKSLVENVHHYFLCILASTHSFIFTTLSSSSKHQPSSKLFHLIFGNKTPKCKFNVIFFSWFSVMLTLGTYRYSTICSMPPPPLKKNGFFNVHSSPEGVLIENF